MSFWLDRPPLPWRVTRPLRRAAMVRMLVAVTAVCLGLLSLSLELDASRAAAAPNEYDTSSFRYDAGSAVARSAVADWAIPLVPAATLEGSAERSSDAVGRIYDSTRNLVAPRSIGDDLVGACLKSFAYDTEVLMADGTTTPISEIVVGDEVWAFDPETGEAGNRTVTAVWPHHDWLLEFTVEGGSITTTEDHHFWNVTDAEWQETQHFDPGDYLLTAEGHLVEAGNLDWTTSHYADAYDLTVEGLHTYFVSSGDGQVLVHNCNGIRNSHLAGGSHPITGVPFDKDGFPVFDAWRHPEVADVRIELSGSRSTDIRRANAQASLETTPSGYTWHHHQDSGLIQLVESDIHRRTGHTGGFSTGG